MLSVGVVPPTLAPAIVRTSFCEYPTPPVVTCTVETSPLIPLITVNTAPDPFPPVADYLVYELFDSTARVVCDVILFVSTSPPWI